METKQIISWLCDKAARAQDHSYARMLNMAAKRLKELDQTQSVTQDVTQSAVKWIPVTERLPGKSGKFLVYRHVFGNVTVVSVLGFAPDGAWVNKYDFQGKKNVWYDYDSEYGYFQVDSVTHWMPLPEPPEEVET